MNGGGQPNQPNPVNGGGGSLPDYGGGLPDYGGGSGSNQGNGGLNQGGDGLNQGGDGLNQGGSNLPDYGGGLPDYGGGSGSNQGNGGLNQGGDGLNQGGDGLNQGDNVNGGGSGVNLPDYGGDNVNGGGSGINNNYGGDDLNDLYGDYDLANYLYETPPVEIDYFGPSEPEEDPVMYFDQITTTTVPPDMYDYLFAFEKPNRNKNRLKGANSNTRKKFDAQALKAAYATLLEKSKTKSKNNSDQEITRASRVPDFGFRNSRVPDFGFGKSPKSRVTRSIFSSLYDNFSGSKIARSAEEIARQFLQRFTGPGPTPRVWGLLDRRAPGVFRQGAFVKISLSQFSIVSTGTTGRKRNLFSSL